MLDKKWSRWLKEIGKVPTTKKKYCLCGRVFQRENTMFLLGNCWDTYLRIFIGKVDIDEESSRSSTWNLMDILGQISWMQGIKFWSKLVQMKLVHFPTFPLFKKHLQEHLLCRYLHFVTPYHSSLMWER